MIINDNNAKSTAKPEMEHVEKEKHEHKLIGTFLRRKGLRLYAYSSLKNEIREVVIKAKNNINTEPDENGKLIPIDLGLEEATVDSSDIHFEALNLNSALKRLNKFKTGVLKELCNLRKPDPEGIKLF